MRPGGIPFFARPIGVILLLGTLTYAANSYRYSGRVLDADSCPITGAMVTVTAGGRSLRAITDTNGAFSVAATSGPTATATVTIRGFAEETAQLDAGEPAEIRLRPESVNQTVVVSAERVPVPIDMSSSSVRVVNNQELRYAAAPQLDDKLREVPGLDLFRRSSSLVANPTAQGVSLRGLGSTAASRTLVLANDTPLNDPVGGWIHWDEIPSLLVQEVEVVRGGTSDLYGSSAVGGLIDMFQTSPASNMYELQLSGDTLESRQASFLGSLKKNAWSGLLAADDFRTDGYIMVPAKQRGPVDTAADVHYQNAHVEIDRALGNHGRAFVTGNVLNEARDNGTPLQDNGTRLWRYVTGMDWTTAHSGSFSFRVYGDDEHYRQTFSSINSMRTFEKLTRLQQVPSQEWGGSLQYSRPLGAHFTFIAGGDARDVRATDVEFPAGGAITDVSSRQRQEGAYSELLFQGGKWAATASIRLDHFSNIDSIQNGVPIPDRSETVPNPKLGVVRRVTKAVSVFGNGYRAFRSPTINELYRTSQVGTALTIANPNLLSERATGWESGLELASSSQRSVARVSYFWTEVNRPVTALTLSITPSQVLKQRANLGQIRSRGIALDFNTNLLHWLQFAGGYQYADATVTRFDQAPSLVGKWIPEVPRNTGTAQATFISHRLGILSLQGRASGRQYDDDLNTLILHSFFAFDLYASRPLTSRVDLFVTGQNLLNRDIEVSRSTVVTLGTPRLVRLGVRLHSAR